jgi:hypothetical protein
MAVKHGYLKKYDTETLGVRGENSKKIFGPTKENNGIWRI